jgi:prepilin-type N-terminal cleavage/methylation domain-containing protein
MNSSTPKRKRGVWGSINSAANSRGMTLLEVLISLVILATVLLAMTSLMDIVQQENWYNHHFTVASFLAQGKSEELQNLDYDNVELVDRGDWATPQTIGTTGAISANGYYTRQWKITDDTPTTGNKEIEVQTQWTDRSGKVHTVSFKSIKGP